MTEASQQYRQLLAFCDLSDWKQESEHSFAALQSSATSALSINQTEVVAVSIPPALQAEAGRNKVVPCKILLCAGMACAAEPSLFFLFLF